MLFEPTLTMEGKRWAQNFHKNMEGLLVNKEELVKLYEWYKRFRTISAAIWDFGHEHLSYDINSLSYEMCQILVEEGVIKEDD